MDDQLDNDLKKRITEVFENYEDTTADEGWLLLREKYPEKAKRRIAAWIWWAPAAALLLLFLGILWFKPHPANQQQVAVVKRTSVHFISPGAEGEKKKNNIPANNSATQQNDELLAGNTAKNGVAAKNPKHKQNLVAQSKREQEEFAVNTQKTLNPTNSKVIVSPFEAKNPNQEISPDKAGLTGALVPKNPVLKPSNPESEIIAKVDSGNKSPAKSNASTSASEVNMLAQQPNKNSKSFFADENQAYKKQKTPLNGNAVNFSVYTTSYINYAKGSNHQFNMGAGFTSDIRLTKNLLISTGMSIGQNSLSYAGQPPVQNPTASSAVTLATSSLTASMDAFTASASSSPAFKNYSANLVGLDIPLNLKFVLNPRKSGTYLLAGFSSGTYINELYTYSYNNPSLFSAGISQVQDQSTRSSFNGFYFAKTLNLAVGTGYLIGHSHLVVEPFLKYPLEGLGSQQLRFGAGGVNLKFNFNGFKK